MLIKIYPYGLPSPILKTIDFFICIFPFRICKWVRKISLKPLDSVFSCYILVMLKRYSSQSSSTRDSTSTIINPETFPRNIGNPSISYFSNITLKFLP